MYSFEKTEAKEVMKIEINKSQYVTIEKMDNNVGVKVMFYTTSCGVTVPAMICTLTYNTFSKYNITEIQDGKLITYPASAGESPASDYVGVYPCIICNLKGRDIIGFYDEQNKCIILTLKGNKYIYVVREIYIDDITQRFKMSA